MTKKIILSISLIFIVGIALFGIGFIIEPNLNIISNAKVSEGSKKLNEIENLDIEVIGADIYLTYGSEYSITYRLNEKEEVSIFEDDDQTLHFKTKTFNRFGYYDDDWQVVITIPQDAKLKDVHLKSVSGTITSKIDEITNLDIKTTSGDIKLNNTNTNTLDIDTTSGDIDISGIHAIVDLHSVSGDIEYRGSVNNYMNIKAVSSDMELAFEHNLNIDIDGFMDVEINDVDYKHGYISNNSNINLKIKSVSGDVEITTK